jgi:hypothetical protein
MNALMTRLVIQQSAESTPQSSAPAVALASKEINKIPPVFRQRIKVTRVK